MSTASNGQRDAQFATSLESVVLDAIDERIKDLHTCLPGIIESYDPEKQTAVVRAAIRREFVGDDGAVELPPLPDLPVVFPAGGNFVMTFPIAKGDECIVVFAERAIDAWWDRGGAQDADDDRFHDLSDAFVIVGVSSRPRFLKNVATDAAELRTRDGTVVLRIEGDKIVLDAATVHVGGVDGSQPAVLGDVLNTILQAIKSHLHPTPSGLASPSAELAAVTNWDPRAARARVK